MAAINKNNNFVNSEIGIDARQKLMALMRDELHNTPSTYSSNTEVYPDSLIPFVDKHMEYLRVHPNIDPQQYISNLRLMSKIKKVAS